MPVNKFQCTECESTFPTFAKAAKCCSGIGGVVDAPLQAGELVKVQGTKGKAYTILAVNDDGTADVYGGQIDPNGRQGLRTFKTETLVRR